MTNYSPFQWRERGKAGYVSVALIQQMDYVMSKSNNNEGRTVRGMIEAYNKILSHLPATPLVQIPEFRIYEGYPIILGFNLLRRINPQEFKTEKCVPVPQAFHVNTTVEQMCKRWKLRPLHIG